MYQWLAGDGGLGHRLHHQQALTVPPSPHLHQSAAASVSASASACPPHHTTRPSDHTTHRIRAELCRGVL
jgi:hypothetical protein